MTLTLRLHPFERAASLRTLLRRPPMTRHAEVSGNTVPKKYVRIDNPPVSMSPRAVSSTAITELLRLSQQGDSSAAQELFDAVYAHLRQIAALHLRKEGRPNCLDPTELVHEAYFKLFGEREKQYTSRAHFWGVATQAMRCILVDLARKRRAAKRVGELRQVTLNELMPEPDERWPEDMLFFDQVRDKLAQFDARSAQIVDLKMLMGFTDEEIGQILGVSERTVKRDFKAAKAWLRAELGDLRRRSS